MEALSDLCGIARSLGLNDMVCEHTQHELDLGTQWVRTSLFFMLRRSFSLRVFFSRRCRTRASNDEEACGRVTVGMSGRKTYLPLVQSRLFDDNALLTLCCLARCRDDLYTVVDSDRCHGGFVVNIWCKWQWIREKVRKIGEVGDRSDDDTPAKLYERGVNHGRNRASNQRNHASNQIKEVVE